MHTHTPALPARPARTAPPATAHWPRRFVLTCHWTLAASFVVAWFSDCMGAMHQGAGVLALGLVAMRVLWGLATQGSAGPATERRIGTAFVVLLLGAVAAAGLTGWMLTLEGLRNQTAVILAHLWAVDLTLVAIGVHVLDTLFGSLAPRINAEAP